MSAVQARQPRRRPLRTETEICTSPESEIGRCLDEAIVMLRKAMPAMGLKLVVPPPLPDGRVGRLSISMWRRGGQAAPVHSGVTAQEAVQKLFDSTVEADCERRRRARCRRCSGIGWYITVTGIRAICAHQTVQD